MGRLFAASLRLQEQADDTWQYTQESYCIAAAKRYNDYLSNIITNKETDTSRYSGYSSIIFADTVSHGRQYGSEVCRVSGKVDASRLPKEAYFTYRVVQNPQPDLLILGHWNYPDKTKKTIYVISNTPAVELFLNGKSLGKNEKPDGRFVFPFPDIAWQAGTLKAVGAVTDGSRSNTNSSPSARQRRSASHRLSAPKV